MIRVLSPGAFTTFQDAGRAGHEHLGVPTSGPFDAPLHALANTLVDNIPAASALEITALGPTLTFEQDAVVALAGQFLHARLDGSPVPAFHTLTVSAGSTLTTGPLTGAVRGYVAISGGFDAPPTLGSSSTCTLSGLGPAALRTGDVLHATGGRQPRYRAAAPAPLPRVVVRVLPGPHRHLFTDEALAALTVTTWRVSPDSSRVGVRLTGAGVAAPAQSLPSLAMVTGAIQVPPSGLPIVLGPDHGATGGYPVPFVVASADLPVIAQAAPGAALVLREVADAPVLREASLWDLDAVCA